jgi:hypothetical protein
MRILYLSFYFEPDLSAGSFRNSSLSRELSSLIGPNDKIEVVTTMPNRYHTYLKNSKIFEKIGNLEIYRIPLPKHKNGFIDQLFSFRKYFFRTLKVTRKEDFDLVFASSSRLFTAFLGRIISRGKKIPLYLDIRDIFLDNLQNVLKNPFFKWCLFKLLKIIERYTFSKATHINLISAGFEPYFKQYSIPCYSYFSNGIDEEFLKMPISNSVPKGPFLITYAGNIGEGQGLEKIVPLAAKKLEKNYRFRIIGEGGMKETLIKELKKQKAQNVEIISPVSRSQLIEYYRETHILFLHLNDYPAFEKVLPSKIFEYAATDKPIIAGVCGYTKRFISENIRNTIIFDPGDVEDFVKKIQKFKFSYEDRPSFKQKYSRKKINEQMAKSILRYVR